MKKVIVVAVILAVLINAVVILVLYQKKIIFQPTTATVVTTPTAVASTQQQVGNLKSASGKFTVQRSNGLASIYNNMPIFPGDTLNTPAGSQVALTMNNGASVEIAEVSAFKVLDATHWEVPVGQAHIKTNSDMVVSAKSWGIFAKAADFVIVSQAIVTVGVNSGSVTIPNVDANFAVPAGMQATLQSGNVSMEQIPR